jgi:crotonobetainyl-CoA:carnitine CoA-transferase CaiB-like acyl-CoA transferase
MGQFEDLLDMRDEWMTTTVTNSKQNEMIQIVFPALFSEDLDYKRSRVPALGDHSIETLKSSGYASVETRDLRKNGTI